MRDEGTAAGRGGGPGGDGPLLLGLDLGTTTLKAVLVDADGGTVRSAARPTPFSTTGSSTGTRSEMPVAALLETVRALLRSLSDELPRVAGVGIGGMAESGAPLGRDGRPLAPVIAWHDPRGAETVARLDDVFEGRLALRTGQRPRTVSSVAKLGWLTANGLDPAAIRVWLGTSELVLRALTGSEATEHSFACRTGCYDVAAQRWIDEAAAVAGVGTGIFPPVRAAGEPMGRVTYDGAGWSGLPAGVPVTLAGHDHLAGAAGAGAVDGDLVNSVGTAETVVRLLGEPPDLTRAAEVRGAASIRPSGRGWSVMTGAARAGVVLGRVAAALGAAPAALDALAEGADPVAVDDGTVRAIQERDDGPVPAGPPGAVWLGVLEALSRRTFEAAGRVAAVAGDPARMLVFGGGSRSRIWTSIKARMASVPVVVPRAGEAAGRGAALFAGVAAGWWAAVEEAPAPDVDTVAR